MATVMAAAVAIRCALWPRTSWVRLHVCSHPL